MIGKSALSERFFIVYLSESKSTKISDLTGITCIDEQITSIKAIKMCKSEGIGDLVCRLT